MSISRLVLIAFIASLIFTINLNAAQFNFTPRVAGSEEYTDNLFLTKENRQDEFITSASAGFTAELLGRQSGLTLSAFPAYVWYREYSELNTWRLPAVLTAYTNPSKRTTIQFADTFVRTEDPEGIQRLDTEIDGVEEIGDTTVRRGREPYYQNNARLSATYQFGELDKIYAGVQYGLLRNEDETIENNDNYGITAGLDYSPTYQVGTQLSFKYTRGEYTQQSQFTGEPSSDFRNYLGSIRLLGRVTRHFALYIQYDQIYRDFDLDTSNDYIVYAPSAGFLYDITKDAYLRLGAGYYYQQYIDQDDQEDTPEDDQQLFFDGEITKTWIYRRGTVQVTGLAGLTQNDFGAQNLGFQRFAAILASADYRFTRRFVGDASAYCRYSTTPGVGMDAEDREDIRTNFNAGIGYFLTRWMELRLGYGFNYYYSNVDDNYYENRGMLTITLQPDQPWRF